MTQQFDLMMYLPGMSFKDTEELTTTERLDFYQRLRQHFEEKKKQQQQK